MTSWIGWILVAGFVVFLVGAVRWRLDYEQPLEQSLPLIHADRARRAWIHGWMLVAMFITPTGVAGFATTMAGDAATIALMATVVYTLGSAGMIVSLTYGLTVVPWAAEQMVGTGSPPEGFAAQRAWTSLLYIVHMLASYTAFAVLGAAVVRSQTVDAWSGWLGIGLGAGCLLGFVGTRFAGPFNPPILAHTYTAVLGVVLLAM